MASRKAFPLRIDAQVYAALEGWAADELRSVNGQIEFLLREALKRSGRLQEPDKGTEAVREDMRENMRKDIRKDIFAGGKE